MFIASDDKTLYFTSNGHIGYGSYDVYMTKRLDDTWLNWSKPTNLGPKINTKNAELYFVVSGDGKSAYTSATGADGSQDLFYYNLQELKNYDFVENIELISGTISNNGQPIHNALISYSVKNLEKIIGKTRSDVDGNYTISLTSGERYLISIEADGYNLIQKTVNLKDLNKFNISELHINLPLLSITFKFNSFLIDKNSLKFLDRYIDNLNLDPLM